LPLRNLRKEGKGMDHVERALELNRSGYNCAQSVFCAFSDITGVEEKTALSIAAGLGGGVRAGEVCGAVSGAALVLGALYPFCDSTDYEAKQRIASLAREFCARFKEKYGTVRCDELLKRTEGEEKRYKYCPDYVRDCAQLLEEMIAEQK